LRFWPVRPCAKSDDLLCSQTVRRITGNVLYLAMALKDKFDRTYTVNTSLSKSNIVNTLKERIEVATKETSWFTFKDINYKKIQVDDYRAIIKLDPVLYGQVGGIGVAMLNFEVGNGFTKIEAVVKPFVTGLWIVLGFLVFFSVGCIWLITGTDKFLFIAFAWSLVIIPGYISIAFRRYRITRYLKLVLSDIGIQEALNRVQS
jgi:hypothetical protein